MTHARIVVRNLRAGYAALRVGAHGLRLPGDETAPGESPKACAVRACFEQTGITVVTAEPLLHADDVHVFVTCCWHGPTARPDVRWLDHDELAYLDRAAEWLPRLVAREMAWQATWSRPFAWVADGDRLVATLPDDSRVWIAQSAPDAWRWGTVHGAAWVLRGVEPDRMLAEHRAITWNAVDVIVPTETR